MKFLLTSDWHIANGYPFSTSPNPFGDLFYKQTLSACKQIIDYASTNNCFIIHAGDLLNSEKITSPDFYTVNLLLAYAKKKGVDIYLNLGNHEIDYISTIPSIIQTLAMQYPNIVTINSKEKYHICNAGYNWNIYLIPYYRESVFNDVLKEIDFKPNSILVIHQNIKGIKLKGGAVIQEGIDESIFDKLQNKVKLIVCGHIHQNMNIIKSNIPFIIPGSICSTDFRDEGSIKSFYEVEIDEGLKIQKPQIHEINNQIGFNTCCVENFNDDEFLDNFCFKRTIIKVKYKLEDDIKNITDVCYSKGTIKVIPELMSSSSEPDLTSYARPVDMTIDDWLEIWLKQNEYGFEDEEIKDLMEFNREVFK